MKIFEGAVIAEIEQKLVPYIPCPPSATRPEKAHNGIDPHFQTQSKEFSHAECSKNVLEGKALSVSGIFVS